MTETIVIPAHDVEESHALYDRIRRISSRHQDALEQFWLPEQHRFALQMPDEDGAPHVATSATCALSFLDAIPRAGLPAYLDQKEKAEFVDWLLSTPWRSETLPAGNVYTTALVVSAILGLEPTAYAEGKVQEGVGNLVKRLRRDKDAEGGVRWPTPRNASRFPPSGFLSYWTARTLESYVDACPPGRPLRGRAERELQDIADWAKREVYRQIAYRDMDDYDKFEPFNLAYALAIVDRNEERRGERPNTRFLAASLHALFSTQLPNGLWARGLPKFVYGGRGNVYPFSFEVLAVVLQIGARPTQARQFAVSAELFEPYLPNLTLTLEWAESHELTVAGISGWRPNWVPGGRPHAWSTAAVLAFARSFEMIVSLTMSAQTLRSFRAREIFPPATTEQTRDDWTTKTCAAAPTVHGADASAPQLIFDYFIKPRVSGEGTPAWSGIFYGPPGTAKTSLAKEIARALGWPFVSIETSDFLEEGADRMGYQARRIFRRLEALYEAVVLIDEVEEFVRKRDDDNKNREARLITTAMLTLLHELRQRKNVILILATNHVDEFDRAIRRPGRFDLIIYVAPPSVETKLDQLRASSLDQKLVAALARETDTLARFNWDEWRAFASDLESNPPTSPREAKQRLHGVAKTLTIEEKAWHNWKDKEHQLQLLEEAQP